MFLYHQSWLLHVRHVTKHSDQRAVQLYVNEEMLMFFTQVHTYLEIAPVADVEYTGAKYQFSQ